VRKDAHSEPLRRAEDEASADQSFACSQGKKSFSEFGVSNGPDCMLLALEEPSRAQQLETLIDPDEELGRMQAHLYRTELSTFDLPRDGALADSQDTALP
jgi:hypothetical protein